MSTILATTVSAADGLRFLREQRRSEPCRFFNIDHCKIRDIGAEESSSYPFIFSWDEAE
jgi:hypothetical protein